MSKEIIQWIEYKGKKILHIDYSGLTDEKVMLSTLDEINEITKAAPKKSLLVLSDVTGSTTTPDFAKKAKESGKQNSGKSIKTAIIGITGLKSILLRGYNLVAKDPIVPFESKQEALDFLAE